MDKIKQNFASYMHYDNIILQEEDWASYGNLEKESMLSNICLR